MQPLYNRAVISYLGNLLPAAGIFTFITFYYFEACTSNTSVSSENYLGIIGWACENRACGLKYVMSFDETYLNIEM